MAAGSGSRYGKLKQFDDLGPNKEFLLEFSIYDAIQNGFNHIVLITKKDNKDYLYDYLRPRIPSSIKMDVIVQEVSNLPGNITARPKRIKPWGTAHAVWCAKDVIKTGFAIINADDFYDKNAFKNAANFLKSNPNKSTYALITYKLKNTLSEFGTVSRGVCKEKDGKLTSIIEHLEIQRKEGIIIDHDSGNILQEDDFVSMNYWVCNESIFDYLEEYIIKMYNKLENIEKDEIYLPFAAQSLLQDNIIEIRVIDSESKWFG
ncbi:MAG: UTP--glucose-1-phosphate uridylyltransferase, partial [Flavobacteriaceae bacterium]|nr:UTP--glucose-1-phosphate uridylyltransferase [Flavobacteriaceae bacterium]